MYFSVQSRCFDPAAIYFHFASCLLYTSPKSLPPPAVVIHDNVPYSLHEPILPLPIHQSLPVCVFINILNALIFS